MDKVNFLSKYIRHQLFAGNLHAVHSPFLFNFYSDMLSGKQYYDFENIEKQRAELLQNTDILEIMDLGAGSGKLHAHKRQIKQIAENSEKPRAQAQAIFQIACHAKPKTMVELGTSLGITTMYLASVDRRSTVHTFEGCPNTLGKAKENFNRWGYTNIQPHLGDFATTLPNYLNTRPKLDVVFFDGNHKYLPNIQYFEWCLPYTHNDTFFVFDDIYWSHEMEKAWKEIQNHPSVRVSIDFFHFGLIIFKKELTPQKFTLKI
ncbi:MAG: class I SAM-dependent methyltransferase [Cytophagales bacterium]|nr:class I SAM-dependent methyltransferase [Cytophagales bacterium]